MGSFTPISLKFCQPTTYGLVSYGFKRHYDPSIFRHIFVPGGFSARDYGIAFVCSLSVCLLFVVSTVNHEISHSSKIIIMV